MSYLDQLFSLEGKFAVVTGASRGLGIWRVWSSSWPHQPPPISPGKLSISMVVG